MENSIKEDIKIVENYLENSAINETDSNFFKNGGWETVDLEIPKAMQHILSDYKRVLKELKKYKNMYEAEHQIHLVRNEQLDRKQNAVMKCNELENENKDLRKENEKLKEYIAVAPNLDEMTLTEYREIQRHGYVQGRAEEQKRAAQIIYENYILKKKIKDKIKKLQDELKHIGCGNSDCNKCFSEYRGSNFVYCYAYHQIKVLKELLESEK